MGFNVEFKTKIFLIRNQKDCCVLRLDKYGLENSQKLYDKGKIDTLNFISTKTFYFKDKIIQPQYETKYTQCKYIKVLVSKIY